MTMLMVTDSGEEEETEPLPDLLSRNPKDGSVDGVVTCPSLTAKLQQNCRYVLGQFAELFFLTRDQTKWCVHDVDTGDCLPVKNSIYRFNQSVDL